MYIVPQLYRLWHPGSLGLEWSWPRRLPLLIPRRPQRNLTGAYQKLLFVQSKRYDLWARKGKSYLPPKSTLLQSRSSRPSSLNSSKANVDRHAIHGTWEWEETKMHWTQARKGCRSRTPIGMWQSSCIWEWTHWQELCDRTATASTVYFVYLLQGRVLGLISWTGVREARPTGRIVRHGKLDDWATKVQRP